MNLPRETGEDRSAVPCPNCGRGLPFEENDKIGTCPYCEAPVPTQTAAAGGLQRITGTDMEAG